MGEIVYLPGMPRIPVCVLAAAQAGIMTRQEFREARLMLGLPQSDIAKMFDVSLGMVRGWENGGERLEGPACILMRLLLADRALIERYCAPRGGGKESQ